MIKAKQNKSIGKSKILLFLMVYMLPFLSACNSSESQTKQGLTVSNLCFPLEGGNVSNTLLADADWTIDIMSDNPWISVSQIKGTASSSPIQLVFKAQASNNPQSRSIVIVISIGPNVYKYIANQDGTENQVCLN
ncbi:MAG: hypothetical protein RR346_09805 [Bacteroidales bacterium]